MDANVFRNMSYGVYIVSTLDGERPTGCTANSIMQITSDPATVAVSMNHNNFTNSCIAKTGKFAFSILGEKSDPGLIGTFGFQCGKDVDKFGKVEYEMIFGLPVVMDSCGYVVCEVIDKMETNTHTVFLGRVIDGACYGNAGNAMTYAYYHNVIRGKSPKNAPTYLPEEDDSVRKQEHSPSAKEEQKKSGKRHKYVCQICGYVYEGEELPSGYKCPICGQGADKFKMAE